MPNVIVNVPQLKPPKGWTYSNRPGDGELLLCPRCKTVGTTDDFDVMGCAGDTLHWDEDVFACLTCGKLVIPAAVVRIKESFPLFGE